MTLTFRRITGSDLEILHRLHSDPATNIHNPYGADEDLDATRERLAEFLRHWDEYGFGYELIETSSGAGSSSEAGSSEAGSSSGPGSSVIGICGVRRDVWQGLHVLNLYWRLLPDVWGRGFATPAGERALEMARAARHREPIVARLVAGNVASARVAEKLGMQRRDDLDATVDGADWVLYSA